jgi:glyoxylase-like metal-dependent hydrolase (beta-lactamase superfamily II)
METINETKNISIGQLDVGGSMWANSYLVTCNQTGESVLVDAPGKADLVLGQIREKNLKYVLMTHNHSDHIGALTKLKSTLRIPVYGHTDDASGYPVPLDMELTDTDVVNFGNLEVKVFHTPGHTRGSLCFLVGEFLFSGDTLFPGGPGYTASPNNLQLIIKSITNKIFNLPDDTIVYPGHGASTMLGKEKDEFKTFSSRLHLSDLCGDVLWLKS